MQRHISCLIVLLLAHLALAESKATAPAPLAVIGGGFSGLTAALELKRLGHEVILYEKASVLGGRAHLLQSPAGEFTFDAGPSWYWMPDVFDRVFERFGASRSDLYNLTRLDPAYRVFLSDESAEVNMVDVPGTYDGLLQWLDERDPHNSLRDFFAEADEKYTKGVHDWIWRPMKSFVEMMDPQLALAALRMNMFGSYESHLSGYTSDEVARTILKWPVIFVGASPSESPAMYSMLSYSGHAHGTFYPDHDGLSAPVFALEKIMREQGIEIRLSTEVTRIAFDDPRISSDAMTARAVCYEGADGKEVCDRVQGIVAAGDYHHMEQVLMPPHVRRYDEHYWERQVLSPSCMLYYLGLDTKLPGVVHHTFFFDSDLESHLSDVFIHHNMTADPTFYVATTSKTDKSVAPEGGEAVFVLVPMSHRLNGTDDDAFREELFQLVFDRMEALLPALNDGRSLRDHIVFRKDYGPRDFEREFYALRGNAFGLANLLTQSLVFKPAISSLADNVVFAGHLTHPGPGVPPSLVSGIVAAGVLDDKLEQNETWNNPTYVLIRQILYWTVVSVVTLFLVSHFLLYLLSLWVPMVRSYLLCIKLYYLHGRTYFAAGTLMRPRRFLDTAAMYALFRVADDCVDCPGRSDEEKTRELAAFQEAFWICLRKGKGEESMHPTLPAIIDASLRREYPDDLFIRFFGAMQKDTGPNIVQTWEELLSYMDGSAAVIGDFMVPILMDGDTIERQQQAMPHARDLGMAFQLTNMIRDIDEDLDLDRQYMPAELCKQYGVDLKRRDHTDPGFHQLIQEMIRRTDQFYESADHGIDMLPSDVRPVIRVASKMYHKIHDKFEEAEYRIFDGRVRVSFAHKLAIATSSISLDKILRIVGVELYMVTFLTIWQYLAPLLSFAWAWGVMAMLVDGVPGCTYAHFHVLFTVPVMYFLLQCGRSRSDPAYFGSAFLWVSVLVVVASVYTTPWDNLLVYLDVWGYSDHRVLATIGWVPIEEYAFFTIETLMVGGFWMACFPNFEALKDPPTHKSHKRTKSIAVAVVVGLILAGLCAWGFYLIFHVPSGLYLGLILSWSTPVLLLQWVVGSQALLRHKRQLFICLSMAAVYLASIDRWAISQGIWLINAQKTVPMVMDTILPFEEALFFLVTSIMCVWGLTLAMLVTKRQVYGRVSFFRALWDVVRW